MIKTAQHLYIKDVLEDFKFKLRGRQIEDVKANEFEKWIESWDSILKDKSKACELIVLMLPCFVIKLTLCTVAELL